MRHHPAARPSASRRFSPGRVEPLEARALLSLGAPAVPPVPRVAAFDLAASGLSPSYAHAPRFTPPGRPLTSPRRGPSSPPAVNPPATAPAPYTPAQVRHAYGFDRLNLDGSGQTIAIIDAYDDPTIAADLRAFDKIFGLPDAPFVKVVPATGTPRFDPGWAGEIALDVEWAHAVAPRATILLVEAASTSTTDLFAAVDAAVSRGAKQVSMSWGGPVVYGAAASAAADAHFKHPGVTFTASAGDGGAAAGPTDPAFSPYVTGVGGTALKIDAGGNRLSETAWAGGGGGRTQAIPRPAYQAGFVGGAGRAGPDVAYNADPNTGFAVYDTSSGVGLEQVGGTSAGAPQWAGLVALVNQGRAARGKATLGTGLPFGTNQALYALAGGASYGNARGDFFDVTTGTNGNPAGPGFDLATGLGSPAAARLVPDLVNA